MRSVCLRCYLCAYIYTHIFHTTSLPCHHHKILHTLLYMFAGSFVVSWLSSCVYLSLLNTHAHSPPHFDAVVDDGTAQCSLCIAADTCLIQIYYADCSSLNKDNHTVGLFICLLQIDIRFCFFFFFFGLNYVIRSFLFSLTHEKM